MRRQGQMRTKTTKTAALKPPAATNNNNNTNNFLLTTLPHKSLQQHSLTKASSQKSIHGYKSHERLITDPIHTKKSSHNKIFRQSSNERSLKRHFLQYRRLAPEDRDGLIRLNLKKQDKLSQIYVRTIGFIFSNNLFRQNILYKDVTILAIQKEFLTSYYSAREARSVLKQCLDKKYHNLSSRSQNVFKKQSRRVPNVQFIEQQKQSLRLSWPALYIQPQSTITNMYYKAQIILAHKSKQRHLKSIPTAALHGDDSIHSVDFNQLSISQIQSPGQQGKKETKDEHTTFPSTGKNTVYNCSYLKVDRNLSPKDASNRQTIIGSPLQIRNGTQNQQHYLSGLAFENNNVSGNFSGQSFKKKYSIINFTDANFLSNSQIKDYQQIHTDEPIQYNTKSKQTTHSKTANRLYTGSSKQKTSEYQLKIPDKYMKRIFQITQELNSTNYRDQESHQHYRHYSQLQTAIGPAKKSKSNNKSYKSSSRLKTSKMARGTESIKNISNNSNKSKTMNQPKQLPNLHQGKVSTAFKKQDPVYELQFTPRPQKNHKKGQSQQLSQTKKGKRRNRTPAKSIGEKQKSESSIGRPINTQATVQSLGEYFQESKKRQYTQKSTTRVTRKHRL